MDIHILPNVLAVVLSLAASLILIKFAYSMRGGQMAVVINYIVLGITFSVTVHALAEMAEILNLLQEDVLFYIMGTLLSLGSLLFIIAGIKAKTIFSS